MGGGYVRNFFDWERERRCAVRSEFVRAEGRNFSRKLNTATIVITPAFWVAHHLLLLSSLLLFVCLSSFLFLSPVIPLPSLIPS